MKMKKNEGRKKRGNKKRNKIERSVPLKKKRRNRFERKNGRKLREKMWIIFLLFEISNCFQNINFFCILIFGFLNFLERKLDETFQIERKTCLSTFSTKLKKISCGTIIKEQTLWFDKFTVLQVLQIAYFQVSQH